LDEIRPDVVHINCCWMPQIALVTRWTYAWRSQMSTSNHRLSIVLTPHGMLEPWILKRNYWTRKFLAIHLYQRQAVKQCDLVIATSEDECNHILELGWNSHVAIVKNGIDVDGIRPKTKWKRPSELLFMSRIHPKKGLEILLNAMAKLPSDHPYHLTVAGSGDEAYVSKIKQLVDNLSLNSFVDFVGPVYGEKKWQLIKESDVVVLPSYSENYGLIIAEALASGTPVVTTYGTPWKSVAEHQCGWWIAPEVETLSSALIELSFKTEEDMHMMGERAIKLAEMDCAIANKVADLYKLYLSNNIQSYN